MQSQWGAVGTMSATANIYLSSDYGKSYRVTSVSSTIADVVSIISMDGSNALYSNPATVYYSSDYGVSWKISFNLSTGLQMGPASCVKIYGNDAYCGRYNNSGFFYSIDKGKTFTKNADVVSGIYLTKCGSTLYIAGSYVVYKSIDNGVTATAIISTTSIRKVICIASYPGIYGDFIWFGNEDTAINYYSNNADSSGTVSWTTVPTNGVFKPGTCVISANGRRMIGASSYGTPPAGTGLWWGKNVYMTTPPAFPVMSSVRQDFTIQCDMVDRNVVCGAYPQGVVTAPPYIYYSTNYGITLTKAFGGAVMTTISIAMSGTNVIAVAAPGNTPAASTYNYYTSNNSGQTYTQGVSAGIITAGAFHGQIGFVGQYAAHGRLNGTISYSSDYGVTWETALTNLGESTSGEWTSVKLYGNGSVGIACKANGIYYSSNYGATWTLSNYTATRAYSSGMTSNGYIFASVGATIGNFAVLRSVDNGATWTTTSLSAGVTFSGVPTRVIRCTVAGWNYVIVGEDDTSANYYSKDFGDTWTKVVGASKPATGAISNDGYFMILGGENNLYYGRNTY